MLVPSSHKCIYNQNSAFPYYTGCSDIFDPILSHPIPFHSVLFFFLNADYDSLNGLQVCHLKTGLDAKQDACKFRRIGGPIQCDSSL